MTKATHTPGPWNVGCTRHTGDLKIGRNTRLLMVGPDDDRLCAVFFDMETARGQADARLIAAAPDLLEALEVMTERQSLYSGGHDDDAIAKARAAIAKAKGEPQ